MVAVAAVLGAVALVAFFVGRGEEEPVSTGTTTTAPEPAAPVTTTTTATSTTTTTIAPLTLTSVTDELDDYFESMPLGWDCVNVTEDWSGESVTDPIPPGSVLRCGPALDGPQEGENLPGVTVLALDAATVAVAQTDGSAAAGLAVIEPMAGLSEEPRSATWFGSGRTCREVVDEAGLDAIEDELAYFALLGYWFIEGRPALMDIDDNDVPCETLFSPGVVDAVWAGGLIGPIGEISPAA